jgi:hypothetical protein
VALATLADVKEARGIDPSNTRRDGFLQGIVDAANDWVTQRTGIDATSGTRVEVIEHVQLGTTVTLQHHPLDAIISVEAWLPSGIWTSIGAWSDAGWTAISAAIEDAEAGLIQFPVDVWNVEADPYGLGGLFTPAPWFSWRSTVLPAVRVTYTTLAGQIPSRVRSAAIALAAYWASRVPAGAAKSVMLGRHIQEDYMDNDIPAWVYTMVEPYRQDRQAMWA